MAQVQNVSQTIADMLFTKWGLDDPAELKKDKIDFTAFSYHPDQRFKQGKEIVIEIDNPSGTADPRTPSLTMIQDLFKLDVWIKLKDSSREARIRAENNRALIKDQILKIIHDNQTSISGIDIGTFGRFLKQDELENNILHNTVFVVGEWRHKLSE